MIKDKVNLIGNYVYTRMLDLDREQQKINARIMEPYILENFLAGSHTDFSDKSTMTTVVYAQYNYLLYPLLGNSKLYEKIRETFHYCVNETNYGLPLYDEYHIQCWLNVYNKGDYIEWHDHWSKEWDSWHGFYCVDVEPNSSTTYRVEGRKVPEEDIVVESKNNLLVLSKSGYDKHRSSEWHQDYPRITVAFDIVPTMKLFSTNNYLSHKNHWIPI